MSTLAEQIAAVKGAIETYEAEALGYEKGAKAIGDDDLLLKEAALYRRSEAVMRDVLATLKRTAAPGDGMRLWLWKNGDHYLAYEHEYPCYPDGGDPLTLGEPIGYAIFKQGAGAARLRGHSASLPRHSTHRV